MRQAAILAAAGLPGPRLGRRSDVTRRTDEGYPIRDEGIDWLTDNFDIPADVIWRLFAFHDRHQAARARYPAG